MNHRTASLLIALALFAPFASAQDAKPKADAKKAAPNPAMARITDEPGLPRVLLVGDSVSIGYTLPVREALKGRANVHRIPANGGPTINGLKNLKAWLGDGKWDVIHFNFGIHDAKFMEGGKQQVPPADYDKNLREVVKQLQATGAKLIWATTTPIPDGELTPPRSFEKVAVYNAVATKVMKESGVAINDLNAAITPHLAKMQNARDVHFNREGSEFLGKQVAASVVSRLPRRLLIIGQGPDGHPPTTHEFMPGARVLTELLRPWKEISTTIVKADEPWPDGPKLLDAADGIALFVTQGAEWMQVNDARFAAVKRLAARGGAISAFHWSVGAKDEKYIQGQLAVLGGTRGGPQRKYIVQSGEMKRVAPQHPILAGMKDFTTYDEFYYRLDLRPDIQPLYTVNLESKDETIAWAWERPDGGRSFGFVCLHFHGNWQMPEFRRFCTQGVLWSLRLPIPAGGVGTEVASKHLELDGVLPPIGSAEAEKAAKNARAKKAK